MSGSPPKWLPYESRGYMRICIHFRVKNMMESNTSSEFFLHPLNHTPDTPKVLLQKSLIREIPMFCSEIYEISIFHQYFDYFFTIFPFVILCFQGSSVSFLAAHGFDAATPMQSLSAHDKLSQMQSPAGPS